VKICKDEEQQDGNESGHYGGSDDETIHRVGGIVLARFAGSLSEGKLVSMVSQPCIGTQQDLSTVPAFDFFSCQRVARNRFGGEASLTMSFSGPYHRKFDHV
jgi:hypothetical protein